MDIQKVLKLNLFRFDFFNLEKLSIHILETAGDIAILIIFWKFHFIDERMSFKREISYVLLRNLAFFN